MHTLLSFILAGLTLLSVSLQRTYYNLPVKEVKRRARAGDELANILYRAVSYGYTLRVVLWFLIGLFAAGFFVNVALYSALWFALASSIALVWVGFVWLPVRPVTSFGERLAAWLAPAFGWLMHYLHPTLDRVMGLLHRFRPVHIHTGLYEKEDLLDLINQQQSQVDNRIEQMELSIASHALTFADKTVSKIMIPRRVVKMINIRESIGPVLMDELHASGHSRFPVFEDKQDNIVGLLYTRDLVNARGGGSVQGKMHHEVYYIHEEQSLYDALQAILKTHQQLLIVVNSFEEYAGIITMEDILEQIIGKPIIDEFDQYDDLRVVATRSAKKDRKERFESQKATPEKPEMLE
ncbi:CBS domain-containing protein [Candidatus Saccharibacteria bacterium]|nr:CBS domain-containing protein [Candidatus Saccharibacteria bacterium]MBI3337725.1 CBS domain-containing protein [Candidatus Saccharibacteria bacterium]